MSLAVMIPALDEAERLPATLQAVACSLPGVPVVVVDSGCTDRTPEIARIHGAQVVRCGAAGYAATLVAGYRHCLEAGCQQLVQLDADGQHPPQAAPALLAALERADLVTGSRQGTGSPGTLGRRLGNALLARAVQRLTSLPLQDVTSGYWALGQRALSLFVRSFPLPGGAADANVRVFAHRRGLRIAELPVYMPVRTSGRSMHDGLAGGCNFAISLGSLCRAPLR